MKTSARAKSKAGESARQPTAEENEVYCSYYRKNQATEPSNERRKPKGTLVKRRLLLLRGR
jgi:hypothetical protein